FGFGPSPGRAMACRLVWRLARHRPGPTRLFVDTMGNQDVLNPSKAQRHALDRADVIIYERHVDEAWMPFFAWAAAHKRLMLTLDDAYHLAGRSTAAGRYWFRGDGLEQLKSVAGMVEKVIVANEELRGLYVGGW